MRRLLRKAYIPTSRSASCLLTVALLVCIAILVRPARGQAADHTAQQEISMHHYVLLFRSTRAVAPEEQKPRANDIAAWVSQVTAMGVTLDPHTLEATIAAIPAQGAQPVGHPPTGDPTLSNIVFFDATREQAIQIARMHPAPRYGVNVEMREWTSPRPLAAKP
jgi:hypothetical protein